MDGIFKICTYIHITDARNSKGVKFYQKYINVEGRKRLENKIRIVTLLLGTSEYLI